MFICPSNPAPSGNPKPRDYHFSVGDNYGMSNGQYRGMFHFFPVGGTTAERHGFRMADIKDGTSNTLMFSERRRLANPTGDADIGRLGFTTSTIPNDCTTLFNTSTNTYSAPANFNPGSSGRAGDGRSFYAELHTIIPPNGASCTRDTGWDGNRGFYTASSYHSGGVNAVMGDGSSRFVRDSINAGTQTFDANTNPMPRNSPYGVWGAMGTRNGGETVTE